MGEAAYGIRPGTPADVPAIVELMRQSLGEGDIPRSAEFWKWKHEDNPFGASPFWVAESEAGLVGVRVFLRWTFHEGGRELRAVRAVDTATHPAFQGRGIFRELTLRLVEEVTKEGVAFVYNTPNEKSRPGYLKMGWVAVGRLSLWVRPVLFHGGGAHESGTELLECADVERFGEPLRGIHTRCSREYLRWRYVRCPGIQYGFASVDPRLALVVYRKRQRRGRTELTLCELLCARSMSGAHALRATLGVLVRAVSADYSLASFRRDPREMALLASTGFVPVPRRGPILTVRELGASLAGPGDPRKLPSWSGSVGDFELF